MSRHIEGRTVRTHGSLVMHPGHHITLTRTQVRVYVECSCGRERRFDNHLAANRDALTHHHEVGGCNCPPDVVELDVHPEVHPTVPGSDSSAPVAVTTTQSS